MKGTTRVRPPAVRVSLLSHVVLIALGALFFLPFYWLLLTSLKADTEIFALPPVWFPHRLRWICGGARFPFPRAPEAPP